jgi:hypothetical protein
MPKGKLTRAEKMAIAERPWKSTPLSAGAINRDPTTVLAQAKQIEAALEEVGEESQDRDEFIPVEPSDAMLAKARSMRASGMIGTDKPPKAAKVEKENPVEIKTVEPIGVEPFIVVKEQGLKATKKAPVKNLALADWQRVYNALGDHEGQSDDLDYSINLVYGQLAKAREACSHPLSEKAVAKTTKASSPRVDRSAEKATRLAAKAKIATLKVERKGLEKRLVEQAKQNAKTLRLEMDRQMEEARAEAKAR